MLANSLRFLTVDYFLKIKYTARIRKIKPIKWFSLNDSCLNIIRVKQTKTINVITSWITLSSTNENGPPFSLKPILLAGTCNMYSKKAIPQLIRTMTISGKLSNHFSSLNFKCPYQANVIKMFDRTRRSIVLNCFISNGKCYV